MATSNVVVDGLPVLIAREKAIEKYFSPSLILQNWFQAILFRFIIFKIHIIKKKKECSKSLPDSSAQKEVFKKIKRF